MAGFIYIMSNPAFPNLLKIGKSKKDPTTDRVNELNQTGVPQPFKVEYYAFVEDEDYLERAVHQMFASRRPNKNREFFSIDCVEAIEAIRQLSEPSGLPLEGMAASKIKYEEVFYTSPEQIAEYRWQQEQLLQIEADELDRQREEQEAEAKQIRLLEEVDKKKRHEQERIENKKIDRRVFWIAIGLSTLAFLLKGGLD